jgi:hypothetical protein
MNGLPNRLYRGKIIEHLRVGTRALSHRELGRKILRGYSRKHEPWLISLLAALERDGLISVRKDGAIRCVQLA